MMPMSSCQSLYLLRLVCWCCLLLPTVPLWAAEKITLQLKWTHAFQFAGYYAALEKGYYQAQGLEVTLAEARPGHDPVDAVLSKQA